MDLSGSHRIAVLMVLAVSGCSLILDVPDDHGNRCAADGDCSAGSCDVARGMCVVDAESPYAFTLSFTLPADELLGRVGQVVNDGTFNASMSGAPVNAVVLRPVLVLGSVRAGEAQVDADVVFVRSEPVLGAPVPPVIVSTLPSDGTPRRDDFATELVPGHYDIEVRPRGADVALIPPFRTSLDLEAQRLDFVLPTAGPSGEEPYAIIAGNVLDASGVPQNDLEIRAIEVETGRRVSSIATTASRGDLGAGGFRLRVDRSAARWVLQVSAPAESQVASAFPTIVIDPAVLVPIGPPDAQTVQLLVPSPDSGHCLAGTVELPGALRPAIGASVTLRSHELRDMETGIVGRFTVQLTTSSGSDEELGCSGVRLAAGGFDGRVLPGTYDVEIRPLEETAAVYVGEIVVGDGDHLGQIFELPSRTVVGGTVQRSADQALPDARVRAIALRVPLPYERTRVEALLNRPNDALTDATGRFSLPLDVGVYDLVVEPPPGSNYPWIVRDGYGVGGSSEGPVEPFDVRTPVVVDGHATFDDGTPIANAQVEAFGIITDDDGVERPLPIGRATTEDDGTFLLLLPPSIASAR